MQELNYCRVCQVPYHWEESASTLRMTFCSTFCERAFHGGQTIEGITRVLLIKGHGLQAFATRAANALDEPLDEEPIPFGQPMPDHEPPPPEPTPTHLWGWPFYPAT